MSARLIVGLVFCASGFLAQPGQVVAQDCTGDCNGNGEVAINEVIICVNIGLELLPLDQCDACDANGDGRVTINEIITSVNIGLGLLPCESGPTNTPGPATPIPTPTTGATSTPGGTAVCGDGAIQAGEQCDDGDNFGGDGCAANCTNEVSRPGIFEDNPSSASRTVSVVQTAALPIQVFLLGGQVYTTGEARDTRVIDPDGNVVTEPGQIPVVLPANLVAFEPASVPGLVCACVRGVADEELFGPGNSGAGIIACGDQGLDNTSYNLMQDHDTTPGAPGNSGSAAGLPDDPGCDILFTFPNGTESVACTEASGELCRAEEDRHHGFCTDGVCTGEFALDTEGDSKAGDSCTADEDCGGLCRSPRVIEFSGGPSPRGSALINNSTSISLLQDAGICMESRLSNGDCRFEDYGPDCKPCTDDDLVMEAPENLPNTTGTAQGSLFDGNDAAGSENVVEGAACLRPSGCITMATGALFDCDALADPDPASGISGSGLAVAFPAVDSARIGDNVTSTVLNHR